MDWLGSLGLTPEQTGLATVVFIICAAAFAAWSRTIGKREGVPAPKVQEFYAGGQLADMGPVRELIEGQGLLIQQQVRTNLALEASAGALVEVAAIFRAYMEDRAKERADRNLDEEVARRVAEQLAQRRRPRAKRNRTIPIK